MEKTAEQCNYSKQVNAEDCKKSSFTTQKNHLMGAPQLPFAETFPCGSKTPLTQYQPNSLHPFAVPYASWAQFYSSPHVTATVFNGTTFYYYHGNPNPANGCQTNLTPTTNCDCFKRAQTSDAADQAHSERLSSINHGLPGHVTSPRSPNRRASFASISSTSSRSSSPFLSSIGSCNSARDSGLVSMTDDDTSSIHEPNHVETREDKLLLLVKEAAEEILSEKNLSQNSYLLRQMKRNQDGYVSIKLLASSKQIRKITNSHNLLLLALQSSKKLKVNKSNTKVKRRVPIINPLDARKTLTSLVLIDPRDINGIDDVTQKFKAYGEMAQIRIVRPGKPIPAYLKGYTNAIPKLGKVKYTFQSSVTISFVNKAVYGKFNHKKLEQVFIHAKCNHNI